MPPVSRLLAVAVVVSALFTPLASVQAAAAPTGKTSGGVVADDDDDDIIEVEVNVSEVVDAIGNLISNVTQLPSQITQALSSALFDLFFQPFVDLLQAAADYLFSLMVWMPDTDSGEVTEIHSDVFRLQALLTVLGLVYAGAVYMGYDPFGKSPAQLQPLLPRLLAALVFGAVAPWILDYFVDLSELAAEALAPVNPDVSGLLATGAGLIVVAVVQAVVLIGVLAVLVVQKVFVLFAAAASPLIALLWAVPFQYTQRQAENLIGAFWAFLLLSPFEVVVLRLTLDLLTVDGLQVADWVLGVGGLLLMLGLPFMLLSSGVAAAGPAIAAASSGVKKTYNRYLAQEEQRGDFDEFDFDAPDRDGNTRYDEEAIKR